jgi:hypothetical protein
VKFGSVAIALQESGDSQQLQKEYEWPSTLYPTHISICFSPRDINYLYLPQPELLSLALYSKLQIDIMLLP